MRLFLTSLLLFFSLISSAQNTLSGKISNQNGKPVVDAEIELKGTNYFELSDEQGRYKLTNIPNGTYTVRVNGTGLSTGSKKIILNQALTLDFTLKPGESKKDGELQIDDIIISANMKEVSKLDSPIPVEVYSKEFFKKNPTPSLFESLQNVNGVRPQLNCSVCNTGDIHINGLEGPYTMVTIDGMPNVSGLSTVYGLTGIPQSLIERMEIVKGPASTLYGSEAVAGLINVITKKTKNAPRLSVEVNTTSWGDVNTDLSTKIKLGKNIEALIGVNYFNYSNPKDNNGDGFTDITLQDRISIFNKWNIKQKDGKTSLKFATRYYYEDRWGGEMNWKKKHRGGNDVYGESIYTSRWELFGTYFLPTKENLRFQFSTNGHDQNSVYGTTLFNANQTILFGQLLWDKEIGKHDLLTGLSHRYTLYDDNTFATEENGKNKKERQHISGLFVQDEYTFNKNHKILAGIRYDYNNLHGNIITPRLNYKWNNEDKTDILRLGLGTGYRIASVFTEDHAALTGSRDVVFEEKLKPERSWNVNLNYVKNLAQINNMKLNLDGSLFYTYFSNRIIADYETNPKKIIYGNLDGHAISQGVSLNIDAKWHSGLKIFTGVTFMDVTTTENGKTKDQLLTEDFSGTWSVSYPLKINGKKKISFDYTGNVYGPMKLPLLGPLDQRPAESPWFSIQNIQMTYKFKKGMELYGGIKNLLNYTPPSNSIARSFDPFNKGVTFEKILTKDEAGNPIKDEAGNYVYTNGKALATSNNPQALIFDPTYVFAPNQGRRWFLGFRYNLY